MWLILNRNRVWNVDVFGVLRGKYLTPAFAIKIGETAIRNCFASQLAAIRQEGLDYMGNHPCLFSEIGIPFDMDNKYAYQTGNYSSQVAALDANHFALEESKVNGYTLWTYVATASIPSNPGECFADKSAEQPSMGRSMEWGGSFHFLVRRQGSTRGRVYRI